MQIHNNPHCPQQKSSSFGMALKVTPAAREALERASMETIQKLQNAGEELRNTKYYNLEIGENLTPRIDFFGADAYVPPFTINRPFRYDDSFSVNMRYDGSECTGYKKGQPIGRLLKFANEKAAVAEYDKLHNMHSDIDRAVELTKLFEKQYIDSETSKAAEKNKMDAVKKATDKLFEMFGSDAHVK